MSSAAPDRSPVVDRVSPATTGHGASRSRRRATQAWLDGGSAVSTFLVAFLPLLVLFLLTANATETQANDAIATAVPAYQFATEGNMTLDAWKGDLTWLVEGEGRLVSNRFPGTIFLAVPAYEVASWFVDGFSYVPGAITAATAAALAMGVLALVLRRLTSPTRALAATAVAALATSTWSVSADILWTHGPGQLWLAVALLGLAAERYGRAGLGFALAVFTRPPTAVIAAVTGIGTSIRRRSLRPMLTVGLISLVGLAGLMLFNLTIFGDPSPIGGYNDDPLERVGTMSIPRYLINVAGTLVSPSRGILVLSPFLLALIPGLRRAWREGPSWARVASLAGVAYMLLHLRANRFSGGFDFITYRLPLEMLTMAAPLLLLAYLAWVRSTRRRLQTFWTLAGISVTIHGVAAVSPPTDLNAPIWTAGEIVHAFGHTPLALLIPLALLPAAGLVLGSRLSPTPPLAAPSASGPPADADGTSRPSVEGEGPGVDVRSVRSP